MSKETEIELTFLAKYIPKDISNLESFEIIDIYFPFDSYHPKLRIRKKGKKYTMTKKSMPDKLDPSTQIEDNISLSSDEYEALKIIQGKKVRKIRYLYPIENSTCEIDVFQDELKGLVIVDVEFQTAEKKDLFEIPDFCLVDVSHEELLAGGMLAGKTYKELETVLNKYKYNTLYI